jgi:hypothetical protein
VVVLSITTSNNNGKSHDSRYLSFYVDGSTISLRAVARNVKCQTITKLFNAFKEQN